MEPREESQQETREQQPQFFGESAEDSPAATEVEQRSAAISEQIDDVLQMPTNPVQALSPEKLAELKWGVLNGVAPIKDALLRFYSGELQPQNMKEDLALIEYFVDCLKQYIGEDLLNALLQMVPLADARLRGMIFVTLWDNPHLRTQYLYKFFLEDGGLDPHDENFHLIMVDELQGLNILALLAANNKYRPVESQLLAFEQGLLNHGRYGAEILTGLLDRHGFGLLEEVRELYERLLQIYEDCDVLRNFLRNTENAREKLDVIGHAILNETYDEHNDVSMALLRLQERDVDSYVFINENHENLTDDELQAIFEGSFYESMDDENRRIRAYVTHTLGEGGFGRVFRCGYFVDEDPSIRFGAAKVPHESGDLQFYLERKRAAKVQTWKAHSVNTAKAITESFIVYESGDNVRSLLQARKETPANDCLEALLAVMDGIAVYQNKKCVHGDLKGSNVIMIEKGDGWHTQLIDNNPTEVNSYIYTPSEFGDKVIKTWVATPGYATTQSEDVYIAEDVVNRFYGIDNKALYVIYTNEFREKFLQNLTSEQFSVIDNSFYWFSQPENLYREGAVLELRERLQQAL
ncbi:MAG TPA: hypothetical protein PKA32_00515 [Candidatus Gracilibacteria bacterium]|nr:hypothetical protein [Candidatus Gracilibacteria bacterium]